MVTLYGFSSVRTPVYLIVLILPARRDAGTPGRRDAGRAGTCPAECRLKEDCRRAFLGSRCAHFSRIRFLIPYHWSVVDDRSRSMCRWSSVWGFMTGISPNNQYALISEKRLSTCMESG